MKQPQIALFRQWTWRISFQTGSVRGPLDSLWSGNQDVILVTNSRQGSPAYNMKVYAAPQSSTTPLAGELSPQALSGSMILSHVLSVKS